MLEVMVALLALFLGRLCLDHVARVRALYSEERPRHSLFHGEKPLMLIPSALGVLLVLVGLALLTLAAAEWLRAGNTAGSLGLIVALALVPASVARLVLSLALPAGEPAKPAPDCKINPVACAP